MPDCSDEQQEDATLGEGCYDPLDRDEWEATLDTLEDHCSPMKKD